MRYSREEILANTEVNENGCFEWQGRVGTHGYGVLGDHTLTHRAICELAIGRIPFGKIVCHKCDNRLCCNPEHLFIASHHDNTTDALDKGRIKRFQPTKITDEQLVEIRKLLDEGVNQYTIAERYGVRQPHISRIKSGLRRGGVGQ